jgi:hypothetical protein
LFSHCSLLFPTDITFFLLLLQILDYKHFHFLKLNPINVSHFCPPLFMHLTPYICMMCLSLLFIPTQGPDIEKKPSKIHIPIFFM